MTLTDEHLAALGAARDDEQAVETLRAAVAIPSVTGEEEAVAHWAGGQLRELTSEVAVDVFAPGRANTWARWGGLDPNGRKGLVLASHLDTVHVRGWQEHWAGTERESPFAAPVIDGAVWGRGVADCKAGVALAISALRQLKRAGLEPVAPVTTLFLSDEESGEEGSGTSAGVRRAIAAARNGDRPISADLVLYGEPTTMQVFTSHMGFFVTDVTITGRSAYFGTPEEGVDALRAAAEVLRALWSYGDELAGRTADPLIGSPSLLVTGLTGGGYIAVPGECRLSLIRKVTPAETLDTARDELEQVIRSAVGTEGIEITTTYPAGRDHPIGGTPLVTDPALEAVAHLQATVQRFVPGRGEIAAGPYWSEGPFFERDLGIPAVYFAPGDIKTCHTFDEHVRVDEYLTALAVYVRFIAEFCGVRERNRP